jgi:myosin-crossreactive antigen
LVKKDINQYKSLGEIYEAVKEYDPNYKEAEFTNEDEQKLVGEFKVVFKNNYCRIIIPLTLKASEYFAQSTQ